MKNNIKYTLYRQDGKYVLEVTENSKVIGHSYFVSKKRDYLGYNDGTWIYSISVASEKRRQHIGSNILSIIEYETKKNRMSLIEGKFMPSDGISAENLKTFYAKCGYSHSREDYEQLVTKILVLSRDILPKVDYTIIEVDNLNAPKSQWTESKVVEDVRVK